MGILYIVATPIGNLEDITLRALKVLKEVKMVLAEDTRVAKKLLFHYNINVAVERYNEDYPENTFRVIEGILETGNSVALTTDAGTPCISDPGFKIVDLVQKRLPEVKVIPIPGPSALVSALSVSGIPANKFTFVGYPPSKNKRQKFFKEVFDAQIKPVVLYESTHRLIKTFDNLAEVFGADHEIFVAKELTKIYETTFRGTISDAKNYFSDKDKVKGEFVIVIP